MENRYLVFKVPFVRRFMTVNTDHRFETGWFVLLVRVKWRRPRGVSGFWPFIWQWVFDCE